MYVAGISQYRPMIEETRSCATGTLGMVLIRGLTEQLEGSVRAENSGGASFGFEFKIAR